MPIPADSAGSIPRESVHPHDFPDPPVLFNLEFLMEKGDGLVFCGISRSSPRASFSTLAIGPKQVNAAFAGSAETFLQQLFRAPHGSRLPSHPAGKIGNQKHHQGMTHGRFLSMLRFPDSGFQGPFQFPTTRFSSEFFFQTIHHIEDIEELEHKLKQFLLRFCIEA